MNKNELISQMAELSGLTKADCTKALNAYILAVHDALAADEDVRLIGLGTYSVLKRKATKARNPRTGQEIDVAATNVPKFKPGKEFKERVNSHKGKK